jgi:hypothetical protein
MLRPPTYGEMLAHIEERTAAMHSVIAGSGDRTLSVPDCPGWTLSDLMKHVGVVQREWAAAVPHTLRTAGPQAATGIRRYPSGPPMTGHDVARRQMQEAAIHAYDAQLTVRGEKLLANDIAVDGIEEFLRRRLAACF